jgi:hypothetical protein
VWFLFLPCGFGAVAVLFFSNVQGSTLQLVVNLKQARAVCGGGVWADVYVRPPCSLCLLCIAVKKKTGEENNNEAHVAT